MKKSRKGKKSKKRRTGSKRRAGRSTVVLVNSAKPKKRGRKRSSAKRRASSSSSTHKKHKRSKRNPSSRPKKHRRKGGARRRRRNPEMGTLGQIGTEVATAAIGTAFSYGADQLNVSPLAQLGISASANIALAAGAHAIDLPGARGAAIGVLVKDTVDRGRFIKLQMDKEADAKPATPAKPGTKGFRRMNVGTSGIPRYSENEAAPARRHASGGGL